MKPNLLTLMSLFGVLSLSETPSEKKRKNARKKFARTMRWAFSSESEDEVTEEKQ